MIGELRALGLAHGLLLGLLLASPLVAPDLLPWGIDALLLVGGFQVRLADRRWTLRGGAKAWISHIVMAPTRLFRWGAIAVIALIAGHGAEALALLTAALLCELVAYPLVTLTLGRRTRGWSAVAMAVLVVACGLSGQGVWHHVAAYLTGVTACLIWLRGPDGEPRALAQAMLGLTMAAATPLLLPVLAPFAAPLALACATWVLAHLSVLRRRPVPWHRDDGDTDVGIIPIRWRLRSRPS